MSQDLAKRAVACKHWRWLPGMLVMSDPAKVPRPIQITAPEYTLRARVFSAPLGLWYGVGQFDSDQPDFEGEICSGDDLPGTLPDLSDPATLGCLLALVREVAQEPGLHVRCMLPYAPDMSGKTPPPWVLCSGRGARWGDRYETEAEALVAALEAAP